MNQFTFPGESGQEKTVLEMVKRLNPDAIRDSDGTKLPEDIKKMGLNIYSTICLVRADQDYAYAHPEYHVRKFLMSSPHTAFDSDLEIDLLDGYSTEKYKVDIDNDPFSYWEVIDRTTGEVHPVSQWNFDSKQGLVRIGNVSLYHEYTVNFLVRQTWDSCSMYNSLVNKWGGRNTIGVDPYHRECREHLYSYFQKWLDEHDHTHVVRFTTFAYQFVIDCNEKNEDTFRDWFGYGECVSPQALADFEKIYGYALRSEDFVDGGYYNSTNRPPTIQYRDWMKFIQRFVVQFASDLVSMAHERGKKTAMFQGDHWIGTETYSDNYQKIGLDINIGAVEDGVALRRLSDSPGKQIREARFYPYFFPDVFRDGGDPLSESISNWVKIRRALLRKPIDRIGYGGRISLAARFPDFINHIETINDEFSLFLDNTEKTPAWTYPVRVGILNSWGKNRSWLQNQSIDQKFHIPSRPDVMEFVGTNTLECLAGLPFDIQFINFDDVKDKSILINLDVIINTGDRDTAWSGGSDWDDRQVLEILREWISSGRGFLGIGDPGGCIKGNRFFQLADVLGVDKETGRGLGAVASHLETADSHFIDKDCPEGEFDLELTDCGVFPVSRNVTVLQKQGAQILRSVHKYGKGRSAYFAGLPFNPQNSRMLLRSILWLAGKEELIDKSFSTNIDTDCAVYPEAGRAAVVNNSDSPVTTDFIDHKGVVYNVNLNSYQWKWLDLRT